MMRAGKPLMRGSLVAGLVALVVVSAPEPAWGQKKAKKKDREVVWTTPALPGGQQVVTDTSPAFLERSATLKPEVSVARTPPTIDFLVFPGQTYAGKPWSAWGDSLAIEGKYYASIGDHLAPEGNAFVYEYDPKKKYLRRLLDIRSLLRLPAGHYTPGKIHGRLDMGSDGWLYFATHRGSPRVTNEQYHYRGDWILRHSLATGKTEVVAQGPVPGHCIPNSILDPERLIFYGGTAPGSGGEEEDIHFFAYDVKGRKLLYSGKNGPSRYMILARSTGRVYYTPGKDPEGPIMRYDPQKDQAPVRIPGTLGLRAATAETPEGMVYTVSKGQGGVESQLFAFNTRTEEVTRLGPAPVGTQTYIAALAVDPTGRHVYYAPGAHGGSDRDGTPVVQYDVQTRKKKVIAFLAPFYQKKYGLTPVGTYSLAIDPSGERLYITWNTNRGGRAWDCCTMTVIHIPSQER